MIDYDKPWGWAQPRQQAAGNTLAPLGGGGQEAAPGVVQAGPSQQDQMVGAVGGALAKEGVDSAIKGLSGPGADLTAQGAAAMLGEGASSAAGSQAAMLASQMSGMGSAGAQATGEALGAASSGVSALGPLGAAAGGLMKGEYDEAAGAALGSVLGAYFGPVGSMIGSKVGGYAGNAVGGALGFADGTTNAQKVQAVFPPSSPAGGGGKGAGGEAPGAPVYTKPQVTGKYYGELNQGYDPFAAGQAKVQQQKNPQGGKGAGPVAPAPAPTKSPDQTYAEKNIVERPLTEAEAKWLAQPKGDNGVNIWHNAGGGEDPYAGDWVLPKIQQSGGMDDTGLHWVSTPDENPYAGYYTPIDPKLVKDQEAAQDYMAWSGGGGD